MDRSNTGASFRKSNSLSKDNFLKTELRTELQEREEFVKPHRVKSDELGLSLKNSLHGKQHVCTGCSVDKLDGPCWGQGHTHSEEVVNTLDSESSIEDIIVGARESSVDGFYIGEMEETAMVHLNTCVTMENNPTVINPGLLDRVADVLNTDEAEKTQTLKQGGFEKHQNGFDGKTGDKTVDVLKDGKTEKCHMGDLDTEETCVNNDRTGDLGTEENLIYDEKDGDLETEENLFNDKRLGHSDTENNVVNDERAWNLDIEENVVSDESARSLDIGEDEVNAERAWNSDIEENTGSDEKARKSDIGETLDNDESPFDLENEENLVMEEKAWESDIDENKLNEEIAMDTNRKENLVNDKGIWYSNMEHDFVNDEGADNSDREENVFNTERAEDSDKDLDTVEICVKTENRMKEIGTTNKERLLHFFLNVDGQTDLHTAFKDDIETTGSDVEEAVVESSVDGTDVNSRLEKPADESDRYFVNTVDDEIVNTETQSFAKPCNVECAVTNSDPVFPPDGGIHRTLASQGERILQGTSFYYDDSLQCAETTTNDNKKVRKADIHNLNENVLKTDKSFWSANYIQGEMCKDESTEPEDSFKTSETDMFVTYRVPYSNKKNNVTEKDMDVSDKKDFDAEGGLEQSFSNGHSQANDTKVYESASIVVHTEERTLQGILHKTSSDVCKKSSSVKFCDEVSIGTFSEEDGKVITLEKGTLPVACGPSPVTSLKLSDTFEKETEIVRNIVAENRPYAENNLELYADFYMKQSELNESDIKIVLREEEMFPLHGLDATCYLQKDTEVASVTELSEHERCIDEFMGSATYWKSFTFFRNLENCCLKSDETSVGSDKHGLSHMSRKRFTGELCGDKHKIEADDNTSMKTNEEKRMDVFDVIDRCPSASPFSKANSFENDDKQSNRVESRGTLMGLETTVHDISDEYLDSKVTNGNSIEAALLKEMKEIERKKLMTQQWRERVNQKKRLDQTEQWTKEQTPTTDRIQGDSEFWASLESKEAEAATGLGTCHVITMSENAKAIPSETLGKAGTDPWQNDIENVIGKLKSRSDENISKSVQYVTSTVANFIYVINKKIQEGQWLIVDDMEETGLMQSTISEVLDSMLNAEHGIQQEVDLDQDQHALNQVQNNLMDLATLRKALHVADGQLKLVVGQEFVAEQNAEGAGCPMISDTYRTKQDRNDIAAKEYDGYRGVSLDKQIHVKRQEHDDTNQEKEESLSVEARKGHENAQLTGEHLNQVNNESHGFICTASFKEEAVLDKSLSDCNSTEPNSDRKDFSEAEHDEGVVKTEKDSQMSSKQEHFQVIVNGWRCYKNSCSVCSLFLQRKELSMHVKFMLYCSLVFRA